MKIKKLLMALLVLSVSLVLFACGEDEHTHEWDNGTVTTEATCTVEGVKTFKCSGCDETKTEPIAKLDHAWNEGTVTTNPSCTAEGVKTFKCSVCDETKTEPVAKLEHAHEWAHDEENHWKVCECGDTTQSAAHVWDEGTVTREATCSKFGYKEYKCECGASYLEKIEKLAHTPGEEVHYDEENHWIECICSEHIDVTPHNWDEGTVTTNPTCTSEGVALFTCSGCDATKEEAVAKLPHEYTSEVTKAPTADAYGVLTYTCECEDTYYDAIPLLGNVYFVPGPWAKGDERFAVYYWKDATNGWADLTDADGDGVYEAKLDPAAAVNIIFCRMNGATTENNWDNKWDQTNDLVLPLDGTNLYTISQWGSETSWKGVGEWTTVVMPELSYTGTYEGSIKLNVESGLYELPLSFVIWNRVGFAINGANLTTDNMTVTGLFTDQGSATWTKVLYTEDKHILLCSDSAGGDYIFLYNPATNTLHIALQGFAYDGTFAGSGAFDEETGKYTFIETFAQWNGVALSFDGKALDASNVTFSGAYAEAYADDAVLYYENGKLFYGGNGGKVTFSISYDPLTKVVDIQEIPLEDNQIRIAKVNADCGADAVAIFTEAGAKLKTITDASTGAGSYVGNGWRLYIIVDAEGRIAYLVQFPPNGFGGPSGDGYYCHSYYTDYTTNPAFNILDGFGPWVQGGFAHNLYEVVVPEGGFGLVAHGTGITAILDVLGVGAERGDAAINTRNLLASDVRLSYDAKLGVLSVNPEPAAE